MLKRIDFSIVNRSFWPRDQVLGEALMRFAEKLSIHHSVSVITLDAGDLHKQMSEAGRGNNVIVQACKMFATSSSGIVVRALEVFYFMIWTFFSLVSKRPRKVYVATDPPILVPFIVLVYCKLFRAQYYYHLQDIHPEAADVVVPVQRYLFYILKYIDNLTIRHAAKIITLSEDMMCYVNHRSCSNVPIHIVDNPSFHVDIGGSDRKTKDIVFCGNAGRLQRMPLLIAAIRSYLDNGGQTNFTFIGAGLYSSELKDLSDDYEYVSYLGYLPAPEASKEVSQHMWALLPIEDEVTRYAFPSKSSSYILSGCNILAVCSESTAVSRWVVDNNVGIVCKPDLISLVSCFHNLENKLNISFQCKKETIDKLNTNYFVKTLCSIVGCDKTDV